MDKEILKIIPKLSGHGAALGVPTSAGKLGKMIPGGRFQRQPVCDCVIESQKLVWSLSLLRREQLMTHTYDENANNMSL